MKRSARASLVKLLVSMSIAARESINDDAGWRVTDLEGFAHSFSGGEVGVVWEYQHQAFGATWSCGSILASEVGNMAGLAIRERHMAATAGRAV